jgi:cellulose synthase/poly-beta-1,6-N-acetylglucosamine synthase-like glycosyltransferase
LTREISDHIRRTTELIVLHPKEDSVISKSDKILVIICAYNEAFSLSRTIESLKGTDILVIDDGSTDKTKEIANSLATAVISHENRLGKAASLADGISYALQNSYDIVVEIGADAIPEEGSLQKILNHFNRPDIGGVSCKQIPVGPSSAAYYIDELIWAVLAEGKRLQMASKGSSHLGAVFFAFRPELVDSVVGSVNDDEKVGISIRNGGYKVIFEDNAIVYFDASSCIGHIFQRRKRMYYGHMRFNESAAPSMQVRTSAVGLALAVMKSWKRSIWVLPALALDFFARLMAWKDIRNPQCSDRYSHWVTTYAKNNNLVIRNRTLN